MSISEESKESWQSSSRADSVDIKSVENKNIQFDEEDKNEPNDDQEEQKGYNNNNNNNNEFSFNDKYNRLIQQKEQLKKSRANSLAGRA